ncbi:15676_t:CDS:2 [Funneliformis geosporum]|uniref:16487_t:CDS:1 n=1 Tax=Funneliformis geosporum TaxID=1117311 RepID=A0A9W4WU49_9GLOM|nr:15676_t:CDS:2 [Funneliformis geosporum]CAI2179095.1 16487_t:CDS:2 [Funneliformis geosporum]
MSEPLSRTIPLSKLKYVLDDKSPYVFILDLQTQLFLNIKISSPEEIMRREYKDLKNGYMIFMINSREAFNAAVKTNKKLRQIADFKKPPSLWRNSPKEVKAVYEKVFMGYKKLMPKIHSFVQYLPQDRTNEENENDNEQIENTEQIIVPLNNDPTYSSEVFQQLDSTGFDHGSSYSTETSIDDLATTSASSHQIIPNESYYILPDWEYYLYYDREIRYDSSDKGGSAVR